jgi:NAD(P)-dependent dehydrogenase (short-subunit alcohol dehydrogenase family)
MKRTWLITGTSKGFGHELVRSALQRGDNVVATSRSPQEVAARFSAYADRLLTLPLDLREGESIHNAVESAVEHFGKIDVLVNNAGYGLLGAIEEVSDREINEIFEINVFGLMRLTRAVLPYLRKQRSGHIVNFSSIAGLVGSPGVGIYNATKFAVEGISEALAKEVAPFGIGVTVVEPGPYRTDFLAAVEKAEKILPDYNETAGKSREYFEMRHGKQEGDPAKGADTIIEAILSKAPPLHLLLGNIAYQIAQEKIESLRTEFLQWKDLSLSSDYATTH